MKATKKSKALTLMNSPSLLTILLISLLILIGTAPALSQPTNENEAAELSESNTPITLCEKTAPMEGGSIAPCTGLLWSISQSRTALSCIKVDYPSCINDMNLLRQTTSAEINALSLKLQNRDIHDNSSSTNRYALLSVALTSVTLGLIAGYFIFNE